MNKQRGLRTGTQFTFITCGVLVVFLFSGISSCSTTPEIEMTETNPAEEQKQRDQALVRNGDKAFGKGKYRDAWSAYRSAQHMEGLRRTLLEAALNQENPDVLGEMAETYRDLAEDLNESFRNRTNQVASRLHREGQLDNAWILFRMTENREKLEQILRDARRADYPTSWIQTRRRRLREESQ